MPNFTDEDKERLDRLCKAFESKAFTTSARQPWQELLTREEPVSVQATMAAEIVAGFSGSWASSYNYGSGTGITGIGAGPTDDAPSPVRAKRTKLGQRGVPDIDFVPYSWRTNRFGSKGPSLVGHPISYTVLGPSLKSPFCDWTWEVQQGAGPNGGDVLSMDTRVDGGTPTATTILQGYNLAAFTIGDANEPNGGVYVLVSDDGSNSGSVPAGATSMDALPERVDTARYELFRVSDVRADQIELHPSKRLGDYFDLPTSSIRAVRAVTLVQPFVARLAAVPSSGAGVGRERTFVFVSPERAASSDLYPPYDGGTPADGTWLRGGFEPTGTVGAAAAYGGRSTLPIPKPVRQASAFIEKSTTTSAALAGQFVLLNVAGPTSQDVGRILHVYHVDSEDGATLTSGTRAQALGWFQVLAVVGSTYTLVRVVEVSPADGSAYFGPGPYFISLSDAQHRVYFTVHDPVDTLWSGAFDLDAVDAARLRNLIDPSMVARAGKQVSDQAATPLPPGAASSRADRAIFDTRTDMAASPSTAANPGSLLDLGFRVVLFPARADISGDAIPDFDRPITSRELVIDPSIAEAQSYEVDYASGVVRLSHSPPISAGGSIVPNGIVAGPATNNPRGEVVLFAACVPYSMEPSQLGGGARITGGTRGDEDLYSSRIVARIDVAATTFAGVAPYFGAGGIVLTGSWAGPPTGTIDILEGDAPDGSGAPSFGTWSYDSVSTAGNVSTLLGVSSETTVLDPTPGGNDQRTIVLRREVFYGLKSIGNSSSIDDYRYDTVYGSSQRAATLRIAGAMLVPQVDGSVQLAIDMTPQQFAFASYQWGYLTAAALPAANVLSNKYYSENGFLDPMSYQDNGNPSGGSAGGGFGVDATQGPRLRLASLTGNGDYKGAISETSNNTVGVVNLGSFTRYITKFSISAAGEPYVFFTGLIGTTGATTPTVTIATATAAPPADIRMVGLRVFGSLNDTFGFFGLGSGGADAVPTGISSDGTGVYHFVMETQAGPRVNFGLFDSNFQLLVSDSLTLATNLPGDATPMYVVTGIRKVSGGAPRVNLDTWFTHVMTRYDLLGPPLLGP